MNRQGTEIVTARRQAMGCACAMPGLWLLFVFMSCGRAEEKRPAEILPPSTMVQVLTDLHLAQAQSQTQVLFNDHAEIKKAYYQKVLKKHGITYTRFKKSMDHYAMRPETLTAIYDQVIEELNRRQAKAAAG